MICQVYSASIEKNDNGVFDSEKLRVNLPFSNGGATTYKIINIHSNTINLSSILCILLKYNQSSYHTSRYAIQSYEQLQGS